MELLVLTLTSHFTETAMMAYCKHGYNNNAFALKTTFLQNSIFDWARDHRVHHKFSETDADPHNAKRGFFFSHIGWLLVRKHPDVIEKGKRLDLNDLYNDPVVMLQHR